KKSVSATYTYDSYGNRLTEVDALGNKTEWIYDGTYHIFPVTQRLPKYFANGSLPADTRFVVTTVWDAVCGLPTQRTDITTMVTTLTSDAYCRRRDETNTTTGYYTQIRYFNEGNP